MSPTDEHPPDTEPRPGAAQRGRALLRALLAVAMGLGSGAMIGQAAHAGAARALPWGLLAGVLALAGLVLAWPFVRSGRQAKAASGSSVLPPVGGTTPADPEANDLADVAAKDDPADQAEAPTWLLYQGGTLDERLAHSLAYRARHPGHGLALLALAFDDGGEGRMPQDDAAALQQRLLQLRAAMWPGDALAVGPACGRGREVLLLIDRPGGWEHIREAAQDLLHGAFEAPRHPSDPGAPPPRLRVGAVCGAQAAPDAPAVIHEARQALREALEDPDAGTVWRWFDASRADQERRVDQASDLLDRAVAQGDVRLVFEPVCRLDDDRVEGLVARLEGLETLALDESVSRALQPVVAARLLRLATAQLAQWRHNLGPASPAWVGVAVPAAWGRELGFGAACLEILGFHGLPPSVLRLWLQETDVTADAQLAARLPTLRDLGLGLVLAGLGRGASTLSVLTRLPVLEVTVGPEVHGGWPLAESARVRMGGIVGLARSLGMAVLAEGLVDVAQCRELAALGVTHGQGPALAPVMPARECTAWLQGRRPAAAQETM